MIIRKRPINMAAASDRLYQCVFALSPANADPLLPVAEVYAYRISDKPCGPPLPSAASPSFGIMSATAEKLRIEIGKISVNSIAIFTS